MSDAPSDGQWAENTHWYTIKNKKGSTYYYLSTASTHTDADGNLMIKGTTKNAQGIWCVVADGTGYKFYNYAEGTGKVLGMTGDEASGRAKMYDASASNDGVWTTFYYNAMTNTAPDGNEANAFRIAETGNKYWNERGGYLAFWNDARCVNGSNGGESGTDCVGSAYIFEEISSEEITSLVSSDYDNIVSQVTTLINASSSHIGELFYLTQSSFTALQSALPNEKPSDVAAIQSAIDNMKSAINNCTYTLPTVGKRYSIKNVHNGSYVSQPITYGADFCATSTLGRNVCWVLEAGANSGSYRFRNAGTNYYMATDNFNPSVTASDYSFQPKAGNTAIGSGSDPDAHKFLHMNQPVAVGWTAEAGASRWTFVEISDEAFEALDAIPENEQSIGLKAQLIASKLPVTSATYTAAKTAYEASKTQDNAIEYLNAAENSKYIRLQNVRRGDLGLSVNTSNTAQAFGNTWSNADASLIWKLEFVDEAKQDYRLKLHHVNTDTYLGAVSYVGTTSTTGMQNFTNGAVYTFTLSGNKFVIKDGNGSQMNCECNNSSSIGCINQWNTTSDNSAYWNVIAATDITLPLTAIGDHSYATTCLPFPVSAVSEGVKAYKGELNDEQSLITLTALEDGIAKGEGVVLYGDDNSVTSATLTIGGSAEKATDNVFSGTTTAIALTDDNRANYRVMGRKTGSQTSIGFFKPASTVNAITANRAYIDATGINTQVLSVSFGTADGIGEAIATDNTTTDTDTAVYDLSGRRVTGYLKSGLYIRGGKKVLVK